MYETTDNSSINKKYETETNCLVNLMEKKTNQSLTIAKGGRKK